uniref:Uncharacterized protein n=1 Tax=uncultured prokaryote TaxID=198431 RepID=A0A0H5Q5Y0_9ZZZZ|nr:hypothetical protein [uncultured prokaryote]
MAYSEPFLRLVAIGSIYGAEEFSFSMSLVSNVDGAQAPDEVPQGVIDAFTAFWATVDSGAGLISSDARLETLKLNEIGTNGRYTSQTTVLYDYPSPIAGASGLTPPAQVALAISLVTPIRRGRAARGRFYLPLPGFPVLGSGGGVTTPGAFSAGHQVAAANAAAALLNDINDAVDGYAVGVTSDIGLGTQQIVTDVRVGQIYDTIRSRRNKLPENYYTSPIPIMDA